MTLLERRSLNNTLLAGIQTIVFNRVPKVGSQMFIALLSILGTRNNFTIHTVPVPQQRQKVHLSLQEQEELAIQISELPQPSGENEEHETFENVWLLKNSLPGSCWISKFNSVQLTDAYLRKPCSRSRWTSHFLVLLRSVTLVHFVEEKYVWN